MNENEKLNTGYTEVTNDETKETAGGEKIEFVEAEVVGVESQSAGSGYTESSPNGQASQSAQNTQNAQYTQNGREESSFKEKVSYAASEATRVVAGASEATVSLVLGILSILCWFFRAFSPLALLFGILGLYFASKSKKCGFNGGIRTAGFVCSLIGLIGGALALVACIACTGTLTMLSLLS